MPERGGSVGKGHKFRVSGTQEAGRRERDAGNGTQEAGRRKRKQETGRRKRKQETGEGAGANEVSGVLPDASRCGAPIIK